MDLDQNQRVARGINRPVNGRTDILVLQASAPKDIIDTQDVHIYRDHLERMGFGYAWEAIVTADKPGTVDRLWVSHHVKQIHALLQKYRPKVLLIVGPNLMKGLQPDLQTLSNAKVHGYIHDIVIPKSKFRIPALCVLPPSMASGFMEFGKVAENMAKLKLLAEGRGYYKEGKVVVLREHDEIVAFLHRLKHDHKGWVAFDTETRNLNKVNNTTLCSMQFAVDDHTGYVIYWTHPYNTRDRNRDQAELRPLLIDLFAGQSNIFGWVMHNAQFDLQQMRAEFGVMPVKPVFDTMLLLHMMDQSRNEPARMTAFFAFPYSLKQSALEFLGFRGYEDEALAARKDGNIADLPEPRLSKYAGQDGFVTFRLLRTLIAWAAHIDYDKKLMRFALQVHSPALKTFSTMSVNGMDIDRKHLETLKAPTSPIQVAIKRIKEDFKKDPAVQAVNQEIFESKCNAKTFWEIPWVFDIAKATFRNALFFHSKNGRQYPPVMNVKTKLTEISTAKTFQNLYKKTDPLVALLSEATELAKLNSAYVTRMSSDYDNAKLLLDDLTDGKVHGQYQLHGTQTGRLACFPAGTLIEVVRDVSKATKGIPIEQVKPGDLVYCLTEKKELAIAPVKHAWCSGVREIVRLHWQSGYTGKSVSYGHVDLTPDHLIQTVNRGWVAAEKLVPRESVHALRRIRPDALNVTGGPKEIKDHRFVWEQVNGEQLVGTRSGDHVHHKDGNHLNNVPSNLERLTASEHAKEHNRQMTLDPAIQALRSKLMIERHARGDFDYKSGSDHYQFLQMSRYSYIRKLFRAGGRPSRSEHDFEAMLAHGEHLGVDWRDIQFRFDENRQYLSKTRIRSTLEKHGHATTNFAIFEDLRIGSRRLKALCAFYGVRYGLGGAKIPTSFEYHGKEVLGVPHNHKVVRIERLNIEVPVYDLEVEGHHNFFANEISVHNCVRPNMQQIPRAESPLKTSIKNIFTLDPQGVIAQADFAAAEVRMWGSLSGDEYLCQLLVESVLKRSAYRADPTNEALREEAELMADIHKQTAALMFGLALKDVTKPIRSITKSIVFGLIYGRGIPSIAEQLGKTAEETEALCKKFFAQFPGGAAWLDDMKDFCKTHGYVETPFGRRRYLPMVFAEDRKFIEAALRRSINTPVQSTTGDFATLSIALLNQTLIDKRMTKHFWLVNAVHDSTLVRIPRSRDALAEIVPIIRDAFTVKSAEVLRDKFRYELRAPMDIDMEVAQHWTKKCTKCGETAKAAYVTKCKATVKGLDGKALVDSAGNDIVCGSEDFTRVELNGGWGTLIGVDETQAGYTKAAAGF